MLGALVTHVPRLASRLEVGENAGAQLFRTLEVRFWYISVCRVALAGFRVLDQVSPYVRIFELRRLRSNVQRFEQLLRVVGLRKLKIDRLQLLSIGAFLRLHTVLFLFDEALAFHKQNLALSGCATAGVQVVVVLEIVRRRFRSELRERNLISLI